MNIKNGTYTFADGFEPSYIAIEARVNFDLCISKVEITYKCEPVVGTITSKDGPAYKYDYAGKEFTTANGDKVAYNVTEQAPWVHSDALNGDGSNFLCRYGKSTYTSATKTWTSTGPDYLDIIPANGSVFLGLEGRKVITFTFTLNVENGATGWGGQNCDLYIGVNGNRAGTSNARVFATKVLTKTQGWESYDKVVSFVDATTGEDLTGKSAVGKKVSVTYDATGVTTISSLLFGTSNPGVSVTLDDITFKTTACGHAAYETITSETPYQYQGVGTYRVCTVCGERLETSTVETEAAPWKRLKPYTTEDVITDNHDGTYTTTTPSFNSRVYFNLPTDLEGRTELALTIQTVKTYDLYIDFAGEAGRQFPTQSTKINWSPNAMVKDVFDEFGSSLNYNSETYSISKAVETSKFTIVFDLTKASASMAGKTIYVNFYAVGTHSVTADLRTPCDHTTLEEFSTGVNCGTRCSSCGQIATTMSSSLDYYCPAAHPGIFTYETGVTFDGRKDCLKTTTTEFTNTADMGYTINYKLYFRNLVKNARAAGKTLISLNVYNKASTQFNVRIHWGVGNNVSAALADHYNNPTNSTGTNLVKDNTTLTTEAGAASKLPANQWIVITLDVSDAAFEGINDFFITAAADTNSTPHYPIETYVSNIRCSAPTVE